MFGVGVGEGVGEGVPTMLVKWTPRTQNVEHTVRVRPDDGSAAELYFRSHSCWVATHALAVLGATGLFVALEPSDDTLQLALRRVADGTLVRWLTDDAFPVVAVAVVAGEEFAHLPQEIVLTFCWFIGEVFTESGI